MQAHGLPNFPEPNPSERSDNPGQVIGNADSPAAKANEACKHLLSGGTQSGSATAPTPHSPGPGAVATDCLTIATSPCYAPQQLLVAYGIQPLLDRGITGRGQTITLPEFPPATATPPSATGSGQIPAASDIRQDLADFDNRFHLPVAQLQVVNDLAHAASPWLASIEEVEDTEIVHAVAPAAAIREVLIPSPPTADPGTLTTAVAAALRLGLEQGSVISLSAGAGEQCFTSTEMTQVDTVLRTAQRDHITVVASTGDSGAATTACPGAETASATKGVDFPASDPLALAVGGTTLQASRDTAAYIGETAWNTPPSAGGPKATGGGLSQVFPRPTYQDGIASTGTTRGVPDVSADGDPRTGMALTITDGGQHHILIGAGGASAAAPLWAGVIALANQYAGRSLGFINPALYAISHSTDYQQALHDVTTGTNTVNIAGQAITGYRAAAGWDPATGWGSPNAQALIPLLARYPGQ